MITKEKLVSAVELELLGSAPSDDSEVPKSLIAFWLSNAVNELAAAEINEHIKRGQQIPSIYIRRTELEVAEAEEEDDVDELDERIFVELDEEVLTLNKDAGVALVTTDEGDEVYKADLQTVQLFKKLRFSKPSLDNLTYYRQGTKIYLEGFNPSDIPFHKIFVFYVPKQDLIALDDDEEVLISDMALPSVIASAVQTGKLMLYGTQADQTSDGVDPKGLQYHTAISNPTK